ncbi:hypothetical protein [Achromobacter denitrificans]|uniref:Uncharacterized protein n=1 Tax=Achromobacter denitrificans TaxID=32002 RepID=A0ABZ3G6B7_ACHDE
MSDLKILPACVVLLVAVVCTVAVLTSNYRQECLAAGYPRFTGQLWDPYCVRKGSLGEDEIRRLSDLKEQ